MGVLESKRRILVADDDADTRVLLGVLLEQRGWEVIEATNGQEALEKVIDEMPDVALLDNRMPERTGAEVYRQLRAGNVEVPVILMTGLSKASELARQLGIRYFLPKPFVVGDVVAVVDRAYDEGPHLH